LGLLLAVLAAYGWFVSGRPRNWPVHRYARWLFRAPIAFGLTSLLALAALGRWEAVATPPQEFMGLAGWLRTVPGFRDDPIVFQVTAIAGLVLGSAIGLIVARMRMRRGKRPPTIGDIRLVLPRSRSELFPAALLAVGAAVLEELYFRLTLPLLMALATGSATAGFALSTLLFALAHRYQRWPGVMVTGLAGLLQVALYLTTGSLVFAMLVHALINLNALVLRPAVLARFKSSIVR
jgi:uncharacterized protein